MQTAKQAVASRLERLPEGSPTVSNPSQSPTTTGAESLLNHVKMRLSRKAAYSP